jgi:uncharacterized protein YbaA (DUF1428 family)
LEENVTQYIDGFVLPVPRDQLMRYREVVEKVAAIWKEHGALDYSEYVCDDPHLEGTRSFKDVANMKEDEVVIFGWVSFASREARDLANTRVAADPRMTALVDPLTNTSRPIFSADRMVYGGFRSLVHSSDQSTV